MAGFLYVGAGLGMGVIALIRKARKTERAEESITKSDLPYTVAMIILDIAAPIFLLLGLSYTTAANASLLNNFEIERYFLGHDFPDNIAGVNDYLNELENNAIK